MLNFCRSMGKKYGGDISKIIKKLIKITEKLVRRKPSIEFIKTCLNNGRPPDFSRINLANNELKNDQRFLSYIRWQVTERELDNKCKYKIDLEKEFRHTRYRRS